MDVIRLRTLTYKSKMGFGSKENRERTVQSILKFHPRHLITAYFNLSKITFINEVLDELGITEKWRIEKPGNNKERCYEFLDETIPEKEKERLKTISKEVIKRKARYNLATFNYIFNSKEYLMNKNRKTKL